MYIDPEEYAESSEGGSIWDSMSAIAHHATEAASEPGSTVIPSDGPSLLGGEAPALMGMAPPFRVPPSIPAPKDENKAHDGSWIDRTLHLDPTKSFKESWLDRLYGEKSILSHKEGDGALKTTGRALLTAASVPLGLGAVVWGELADTLAYGPSLFGNANEQHTTEEAKEHQMKSIGVNEMLEKAMGKATEPQPVIPDSPLIPKGPFQF